MDKLFGKRAKDKITGFTGIVTGKTEYLYGCTQYSLTPSVGAEMKRLDVEWFDEGRIEVIEDFVEPKDVAGKRPGCETNDHPKGR